jgi:hypothetical protein
VLSGPESAALTHAEPEDQLGAQGRELLRLPFQGQLDLRELREQRRVGVVADGVARTRLRRGIPGR